MRSPACLVALAGIRIWLPGPLAAEPASAEAVIDERYTWPQGSDLRVGLRWGELEISACREGGETTAGASSPWLQAGPLVGRGMLRLVSDPLGFSASSEVFLERTSLVLDASLGAARTGAVLMPLPGLLGVFVRQGADGSACGAFGSIPLGAGAAMEGLLLRSRTETRGISEDWYFDRSPSPGGGMTHLCGRLAFDAPPLAFSLTAGASAPAWASAGACAAGWLRGRCREAEVSVLLCAVTPGYRTPDGNGTTGQSLAAARLRLGADPQAGMMEAGWSCTLERPGPVPGLRIPTHRRLGVAFSRDACPLPGVALSMIVQAEKEIRQGADGAGVELARFSSALSARPGQLEARAVFGFSAADGALIGGELAVRPSSRLCMGVEAQMSHLAAEAPAASFGVAANFSGPSGRHTLALGLEDYPLQGKPPGVAPFLHVSLSTTIRVR